MEFDNKKDYYAIEISLAVAFLVGLIGGEDSFGVMIVFCLTTYCGLRYLQSKGLL